MLAPGWQVTTVYALVAIPAVVAGAALVTLGIIRIPGGAFRKPSRAKR
jgi:hypothetical protein